MERSIAVMTTIRPAFARARRLLTDDPAAVFGDTPTAEGPRGRLVTTDVGIDLGAGASVHQEVTVRLGIPRTTEDALVVPLSWQAAGHKQVLPTFTGELEAMQAHPGTRLRLIGTYKVPLGIVGGFGDGLVGHRLARRSLEALVGGLAARLEAKVVGGLESADRHREPSSRAWLQQAHPEIYVG